MATIFSRQRRNFLVWGIFALILLIGGALRFFGQDWGQGHPHHPDERAIISYTIPLNTVALTGSENGPRRNVDFPPGGLSFFIPNDKINLRPPTEAELAQYNATKGLGAASSYTFPPNVIAPEADVPAEAYNFWNAAFSPLNPRWFAYGSLSLYLIKFGGWLTGGEKFGNDYEHLLAVGRWLSGMFSMGTLVLIFALGRIIFTTTLGRNRADILALLAMAFMAFTALDIQLAHYAATDVALTFFITLTLVFSLRLMQTGKLRFAVGTGAAIGLALATKISAAPVVAAAIAAALLYGFYGRAEESGENAGKPNWQTLPGRETDRYGADKIFIGRRLLVGTLLSLVIAGLTALVVWFIAMPYAFLDFANFSKRVIEEGSMSRGSDSFPYTRQYVGTIPGLYQISQLVFWCASMPLGLLMLGGLAWSFFRAVTQRFKAEIVLLSFFVPYCLVTFSAEAKFNRYMLPILPVLALLAARLVIEFATAKPVPVRKWIGVGVGAFALVWTLVWALSFTSIYGSEHTANAGTRWMLQNIPNGKSISAEYWDESLPTAVFNENIGTRGWCDPELLLQQRRCEHVTYDIYGDQSPLEKAEYFVSQIRKTDYIILASNRLYATVPKLPWRYPVQIRYYELLFSGKLGFEKVAEFTDYPKIPLLNIPINTDSADESFTVYDHPKVLIFQKTKPLADDEVRGLFSASTRAPWIPKRYATAADLPQRIAGRGDGTIPSATAGEVTDVGKTLLLDRPVDRLPVIDDMGWFGFANENQWFAFLLWYALFQLLGIVGLPIAWRVFRRLPDRGYIVAKPLGGVLVALVIWLLVWTRVVMNTAWTAWLALAITAAISLWYFARYKTEILAWVSENRRLILIQEVIFFVAFGLWVLFRLGNPDLWHPYQGGEKPMEMTYLQGIMRSAYFPPYDPWFADGYINYYFYGQYLVATWLKLSGINPYIGFNLAVPIIYAFVCTAGFSIVYNLASKYKEHRARYDANVDPESQSGPVAAGLFGVFIFAVVGNLDGFLQLLQRVPAINEIANKLPLYPDRAEVVREFKYFRSSRIIPGTINEFPMFSFVYADLHAHLIALPYTLVVVLLGFNLVLVNWGEYGERRGFWANTTGRLWHLFDGTLLIPIVIASVIGFLAATNSWDLPTYLLLIGACVFVGLFREHFEYVRPRLRIGATLRDLGLTALVSGAILVFGYALYWNFFSNFQAFFTKIALVPERLSVDYEPIVPGGERITSIPGRTEFQWYLVIFIVPLLLIVTYLIWNVSDWWRRGTTQPVTPYEPSNYGDNASEDEDEDEDDVQEYDPELDEAPQPVRKTAPGFGIFRLRAPVFAMAGGGADGGSADFSDDSTFEQLKPENPMPSPARNNFARNCLIGLGLVIGLILVGGLVAPGTWFTFTFALTVGLTVLMLLFGRSFDGRDEKADEGRNGATLFAGIMLLAAFGVSGATEVVFLQDDMCCGEYTRMNTIFKFQYQVWALMTLAAAFAGYVVWTRWISQRASRIFGAVGRYSWLGVLVVLLFCVALYPAQAIPAKLDERASTPPPGPTLDGRAYYSTLRAAGGVPEMPGGKYFDHIWEAKSLFEFYDKVKGTPVVLQASIWPYRGGGSWIPINTGLPTVLGWDHHQRQQRYPEQVAIRSGAGGRAGAIRTIYNTASIQEALDLLNRYHVTYIHIGTIERDGEYTGDLIEPMQPYMSEEGYAKFEAMAKLGLVELAYQNTGVIIYKMTAKGESGVITGDPAAVGGNITIVDPRLRRLEDAVKSQPDNPQNHYNLAQYYYQRKEYDKAIASFTRVIELSPDRVNPYHVLGDVYRDSGDSEKALANYKKATEINAPELERPAAFNKYGVALQAVGRYDEALPQFEKTLQLNPRFNEAHFHRAEIFEVQGKKDAAIDEYQKTIAAASRPDDFWAQRSAQKIRELKGN